MARQVGRLLAERGALVLCGGLGGVMEACAEAVRDAGGTSIGVLPGWDPDEAAEAVGIALPTGLGELRNALLARACAAMVAVGGGYGTLSEIAFARRLGRPVATLSSWQLTRDGVGVDDPDLFAAGSPVAAVDWALGRAGG
jgi:uncharacterized protein (TIGR00725 family)